MIVPDKCKSIWKKRPLKSTRIDKHLGRCPKCNSKLIKRNGRYGQFIGCETFPKCRYTRNLATHYKHP